MKRLTDRLLNQMPRGPIRETRRYGRRYVVFGDERDMRAYARRHAPDRGLVYLRGEGGRPSRYLSDDMVLTVA